MKHLAKLILLTLGLVVVVAICVSFLPRHTAAAAPSSPPPANLTLLYGTAGCPTSYVAVLPTGAYSPSGSGCYVVPEGKYLVVTDVTFGFAGCTGSYEMFVTLSPTAAGPYIYYRAQITDINGGASWHDHYATGLVFASTPTLTSNYSSAGCTVVWSPAVVGYLTNA